MTTEELQKGADNLKNFLDFFYKKEGEKEPPLVLSILARDTKGKIQNVMIPLMDGELVEKRHEVAFQLGVAFQLTLEMKKDPKKFGDLAKKKGLGEAMGDMMNDIKDLDKAEAIFMTSEVWVGKYDKKEDALDEEGNPKVMPRDLPDSERGEGVVISGLAENGENLFNLYRIKEKEGGGREIELDEEMSHGGEVQASSPLLEKFWQGIKLIRDGNLPPLNNKTNYA